MYVLAFLPLSLSLSFFLSLSYLLFFSSQVSFCIAFLSLPLSTHVYLPTILYHIIPHVILIVHIHPSPLVPLTHPSFNILAHLSPITFSPLLPLTLVLCPMPHLSTTFKLPLCLFLSFVRNVKHDNSGRIRFKTG